MTSFIPHSFAKCHLSPAVVSSPVFRPFASFCESVYVIKQPFDLEAIPYKNKKKNAIRQQTKLLESQNHISTSSATKSQMKWYSVSSPVHYNNMAAVMLCKRCFSTMWPSQMVTSAIRSKGNHKIVSENVELNRNYNLLPICKLPTIRSVQQKLLFGSSAVINEDSTEAKKNIFQRLKKKMFPHANLRISRNVLGQAGTVLSTCCTHQVDVEQFFKILDLPDTYYSWWLVTELHIWMLFIRLNVGKTEEGLLCRHHMMNEVYKDMDNRAKLMGGKLGAKERNDTIWDLAEECKFAIAIYDLGLIKSDVDLANSLWRRFFLMTENVDVEKLELLVAYVRKTVAFLDQHPLDSFLKAEPGLEIKWPDLKELQLETTR